MDFDKAIQAHSAWKMKLSDYIKTPDGTLKAQEVGVDNACELGKWIYGEGMAFKALPEYDTLKTQHARFHKAAGEIIKKADSGQPVKEEMSLSGNSEFAEASSSVVSAIMAMKRKAV